jgi:hypothetical protein
MRPIMLSTGELLGVLNFAGAVIVTGVSVSASMRRKGSK